MVNMVMTRIMEKLSRKFINFNHSTINIFKHIVYVMINDVKKLHPFLGISFVILVALGTFGSLRVLIANGQSESDKVTPATFQISATGAVSGPLVITTVFACGKGNDNPGFYNIQANGRINDDNYIFILVIPTYSGPETYRAIDGTQVSLELVASQVGKQITWSDIRRLSVITVNSNERSGSVTSILFANKDHSQIHLVGTWVCH
jgi:hypothetical protein